MGAPIIALFLIACWTIITFKMKKLGEFMNLSFLLFLIVIIVGAVIIPRIN